MTAREYIERKNALIKKYTGLILVPESQIIDIQSKEPLNTESDKYICPYCIEWLGLGKDCKGCPMEQADNKCLNDASTYAQLIKAHGAITGYRHPWSQELEELVDQYNDELPI